MLRLIGEKLDRGEAEAIVIAGELSADVLLMDESAGRAVAAQRGIRVLGLLGVLREAKSRKFIPAIRPVLDDLLKRAGFWVSPRLLRVVLEDAGEE